MRVAAIDIGTNSLHMIVCDVWDDGSFAVVTRDKDFVRLGTGVTAGGELTESAMTAALDTLARFQQLARARGADTIVAAATSAVREATNGAAFAAYVLDALGFRIDTISGENEARLIHLGAMHGLPPSPGSTLIIDIGGGSVELALGSGDTVVAAESFPLGVMRLNAQFGTIGPLSGPERRRLVDHIRQTTADFLGSLRQHNITRVVGTSGTILSLGAMAAGLRPGDPIRNVCVRTKAVRRLRRQISSLSLAERRQLPMLDPRRADLAPVGAVLLETLLKQVEAREMVLSDGALREGLILDCIRRMGAAAPGVAQGADARRDSVKALGRRFGIDETHAAQVTRLALAVFDATSERHGLEPEAREWLEYGAYLHDIGRCIGYERHHKHSQYLIVSGGLRGFRPAEIQCIALVARYHRKSRPRKAHPEFAALASSNRRTIRVLGAMVRLAEALDRSHTQVVSQLDITLRGHLEIRLHANGDSSLELLAANRQSAALADALDVNIRITAGPLES